MLKALYALDRESMAAIYGPDTQQEIAALVSICAPPQTRESLATDPAVLRDAEAILSGWGGPLMDQAFLDHAPQLKLVLYGAGSIRGIVTDAFWARGITITSAWAANAIPVAEYTLAQILLSLKHGWRYALAVKREGRHPTRWPVPGAYLSTVGIISLGMVGRRVAELLHPFDLRLLAYDPFVTPKQASALGLELVSLEDIFARADVVTLHAPLLAETTGMITGAHFRSMRPGAAFINTSRGAVVREEEMLAVLAERQDLFAVLDVTDPEPPLPGSPVYTLPNVIHTPHIAGSMDRECQRMGVFMLAELRRYLADQPLQYAISQERARLLA